MVCYSSSGRLIEVSKYKHVNRVIEYFHHINKTMSIKRTNYRSFIELIKHITYIYECHGTTGTLNFLLQ